MRHTRFRARSAAVLLVVVMALPWMGCSSGAQKGAAVGGAVGAGTGAVIGNQSDRTKTGAVVGAAVGAAAGAIIGDYMERQKKDLEQVPGAEVERDQDRLIVTFKDAILFDFDSADLKPVAADNLSQMAKVIVDYPETNLIIIGHTDNIGTDAYNEKLSEKRAVAVKNALSSRSVSRGRMTARGYGETAPVASNGDEDGRAKNRRVVVQIAANEELREKAEQQAQAEAR